ncbi:MAG: hypothetical protein GXY20_11790 [Clostridiales bacterium]|nr:hypothetical protein [Clostridiales bacterium]
MSSIIHGAAIKRFILFFLANAMVLTLFTGCGTTGNEANEQPIQSVAGGQEQTDQTPEVTAAVPADLFSDEMNVFSGVAFPDGYTLYAAGYENKVDSFFYDLYLTAAGDPEEIITYVSTLLGDSSEESVQQYIDTFNSDGGVGIDGTLDEIGFDVNCKITPTEEDIYDYDYVAGCNLRFRVSIEDPSVYDEIIENSYNLNSLSEAANYFSVTPVTGGSQIYVLKNRNNVQITAVYDTVDNVAGVMESMKAGMTYQGFDEKNNTMNLMEYGEVHNNIFFDLDGNTVDVFQVLSDPGKSYKDYQLATTALTALGFTSYIESDALCEYKDEANDLNIVINIPEWGSRPDDWENSCVQFFKIINGYVLGIWYYPEEQKYVVQADKDDTSAKFQYNEKTGEIAEEWASSGEPKEQFISMFADSAQEDVYMQCVEIFKKYVSDTFGMSVGELYDLASSK